MSDAVRPYCVFVVNGIDFTACCAFERVDLKMLIVIIYSSRLTIIGPFGVGL